jgi:flagellar basal body-associated protein FliL
LNLQTFEIILSIILFIFSAALGAIGTLLKVLFSNNEKKQGEQDQAIKDLAICLNRLPLEYVMKEDFVRSTFQLETKVDSMKEQLSEMNANLAKFIGGEKAREKP